MLVAAVLSVRLGLPMPLVPVMEAVEVVGIPAELLMSEVSVDSLAAVQVEVAVPMRP